MKASLTSLALFSFALAACGSNPGGPAPEPGPGTSTEGFNPPPPAEGYTRVVAPVIRDLKPGDDVMYCQYVTAPADEDLDIIDVQGYQSSMGHHAIAFATSEQKPIGTSEPCQGEDNVAGVFIGGIGGEAGSGVKLPDGVVFRVPAGNSIMLNTHFLNTGSKVLDGESVLDIKFEPADPSRRVASLFTNGAFGFQVPARGRAEAVAECPIPRDMEIIIFSNHMHDQGSHIWTEVERADGSVELIHEDPEWTYEMQFNAVFRTWPLDTPLRLGPGDTLRTYCHWNNTTDDALSFPREMCIGVSHFVSDGASFPVCYNGNWFEREP